MIELKLAYSIWITISSADNCSKDASALFRHFFSALSSIHRHYINLLNESRLQKIHLGIYHGGRHVVILPLGQPRLQLSPAVSLEHDEDSPETGNLLQCPQLVSV